MNKVDSLLCPVTATPVALLATHSSYLCPSNGDAIICYGSKRFEIEGNYFIGLFITALNKIKIHYTTVTIQALFKRNYLLLTSLTGFKVFLVTRSVYQCRIFVLCKHFILYRFGYVSLIIHLFYHHAYFQMTLIKVSTMLMYILCCRSLVFTVL